MVAAAAAAGTGAGTAAGGASGRSGGDDLPAGLAVRRQALLQQAGEPREGGERDVRIALEDGAPFGRDAGGRLQVVLEQLADVAGVEAVEIACAHPLVLYQRRRSALSFWRRPDGVCFVVMEASTVR